MFGTIPWFEKNQLASPLNQVDNMVNLTKAHVNKEDQALLEEIPFYSETSGQGLRMFVGFYFDNVNNVLCKR